MKQLVELGTDAVPDLIIELDATQNERMLRSLGFVLRAIGDKRAVPALIRAIPKTLLPSSSDWGLKAQNKSIAEFMQKHDLDDKNQGSDYSFWSTRSRGPFSSPAKAFDRSIVHDEQELFFVFSGGGSKATHQKSSKRELFMQFARKWAQWWDNNWSEYVRDAAYSRVNLPEPNVASTSETKPPMRHYRTGGGFGTWFLEPFTNSKAETVFLRLRYRACGWIATGLEEYRKRCHRALWTRSKPGLREEGF